MPRNSTASRAAPTNANITPTTSTTNNSSRSRPAREDQELHDPQSATKILRLLEEDHDPTADAIPTYHDQNGLLSPTSGGVVVSSLHRTNLDFLEEEEEDEAEQHLQHLHLLPRSSNKATTTRHLRGGVDGVQNGQMGRGRGDTGCSTETGGTSFYQ
ncbi:unnamed protein product, partial [Amoebophrya sp. A120]|eukprot:GSA120T00000213001.1